MRYLVSCILLIVFSSVGTLAQSRLDLKHKPIENELVAKILNLSEMKEVKPPRLTDSNFFLRLYSLNDISNNEENSLDYCTPEVETEIVCGYRYFLAVHSGDLGFSGAVYDLGQVGEITKIEWLKKSSSNFDRLQFEVTNYPAHAFKLNPKLIKKAKKFELTVAMDSLKIKELE